MSKSTVILGLSVDHIVRLTGLTKRQLSYWNRTGFFQPQHAPEATRSPYDRVYSFRDAVGLRTISVLLNTYNVRLPHLRKVAQALRSRTSTPWSDLKLGVWKGQVHVVGEEDFAAGVVDGQYVIFPLIDVMNDVERGIEILKTRQRSDVGLIERKRNVVGNRHVIAGTRVAVSSIVEYLEDGYTDQDILSEFPLLRPEDIQSVRRHARTPEAA